MDNSQNVVIKVPPTVAHLGVLRTAVGGVAARDSFTLDQINDLRLAVEEAATQLLRHVREDSIEGSPIEGGLIEGAPIEGALIEMTIAPTLAGLDIRLSTEVDEGGRVFDESSFSWMILRTLADGVQVESRQSGTTVVLRAHRLPVTQGTE